MSADREQLRQRLDVAIFDVLNRTNPLHYDDAADEIAAALLPVVEAHTRAARADELDDVADVLHVQRFNADENATWHWPEGSPRRVDTFYAGIIRARTELRTRAAALRTEGDVDA